MEEGNDSGGDDHSSERTAGAKTHSFVFRFVLGLTVFLVSAMLWKKVCVALLAAAAISAVSAADPVAPAAAYIVPNFQFYRFIFDQENKLMMTVNWNSTKGALKRISVSIVPNVTLSSHTWSLLKDRQRRYSIITRRER